MPDCFCSQQLHSPRNGVGEPAASTVWQRQHCTSLADIVYETVECVCHQRATVRPSLQLRFPKQHSRWVIKTHTPVLTIFYRAHLMKRHTFRGPRKNIDLFLILLLQDRWARCGLTVVSCTKTPWIDSFWSFRTVSNGYRPTYQAQLSPQLALYVYILFILKTTDTSGRRVIFFFFFFVGKHFILFRCVCFSPSVCV